MTEFDKKIHNAFPGLVVRKDLAKEIKGNAIVPIYVLEYLLGQYCATDDDDTVASGIETVKSILAEHYVHRNEANKTRAEINERGQKKVIDTVSITFNDKKAVYEAAFSNLGISKVPVDVDTVKRNPRLLVNAVWCIATVSFHPVEEKDASPWGIESLKPIQLSSFDKEGFVSGRKQFSTDEWLDIIMASIGFDPAEFSRRMKFNHILRLIPFCERNYNIIELGPKGTGKSHIYSEFSPHGMLLSGGEVTVAKLFVNNANGRIGLVGFWDVVAFDEFAGSGKKVDKALVDIMKNYMANKSFSRGVEPMGAEASMAFVGNTKHNVAYMLRHTDLFEELPSAYHDSAFIDRIHCYVPGWEFDGIRPDMFSTGYGFIVDYLAEMLRTMRDYDYSNVYKEWFTLGNEITTRDKDGINKTFSGLMKIMYPDGNATKDQAKELLDIAIEGRKRVKDQLLRIDPTFSPVSFVYTDKETKQAFEVKTLEEKLYPDFYPRVATDGESAAKTEANKAEPVMEAKSPVAVPAIMTTTVQAAAEPQEQENPGSCNRTYPEGASGISYTKLFGKYLEGAHQIEIQDPYIQKFYQIRNLMEFIEVVARLKSPEDEVAIHLLTKKCDIDEVFYDQNANLGTIKDNAEAIGIDFSYSFDGTDTIHARSITTDTGWKIILDRGLDIFQQYDMNNALSFNNRVQEMRKCKTFEVTYIRTDDKV